VLQKIFSIKITLKISRNYIRSNFNIVKFLFKLGKLRNNILFTKSANACKTYI